MKFLPRVYEWRWIRYNVVRHYTGAPPRADQREAYDIMSSDMNSGKRRERNMANPVVTFEMENGDIIKAELYPEIAPNTVNNLSLIHI